MRLISSSILRLTGCFAAIICIILRCVTWNECVIDGGCRDNREYTVGIAGVVYAEAKENLSELSDQQQETKTIFTAGRLGWCRPTSLASFHCFASSCFPSRSLWRSRNTCSSSSSKSSCKAGSIKLSDDADSGEILATLIRWALPLRVTARPPALAALILAAFAFSISFFFRSSIM